MVLLREAQLVVATAFKCSSTLELALVNVDAALRLLWEFNGAEVTTFTKADANTIANLDLDVLLWGFVNKSEKVPEAGATTYANLDLDVLHVDVVNKSEEVGPVVIACTKQILVLDELIPLEVVTQVSVPQVQIVEKIIEVPQLLTQVPLIANTNFDILPVHNISTIAD